MDIVTVQIVKGHHRVPITVPDYEVPVLEVIHGDDSVIELSSRAATAKEKKADTKEAFEAMVRRYHKNPRALRAVYRTEKDFASAIAPGKRRRAAPDPVEESEDS